MNEIQIQSNSTTENNDDYLFETNVNRSLSKILNIDDIKQYEISDYQPPNTHGLTNCNIIIPSYYNLDKNLSKIFDMKNSL